MKPLGDYVWRQTCPPFRRFRQEQGQSQQRCSRTFSFQRLIIYQKRVRRTVLIPPGTTLALHTQNRCTQLISTLLLSKHAYGERRSKGGNADEEHEEESNEGTGGGQATENHSQGGDRSPGQSRTAYCRRQVHQDHLQPDWRK